MGPGQKYRLPITLSLTILGILILLAGIAGLFIAGADMKYVIVTVAGLALAIYFGPQAAGARKSGVATRLVKAEADYSAPPPPRQRRSYLPRGRGTKPKK